MEKGIEGVRGRKGKKLFSKGPFNLSVAKVNYFEKVPFLPRRAQSARNQPEGKKHER
ncbi:hypothetical protein LJC36_02075 [Desulfovibrio sp. OttesenSCG-928-C14]|nr:hypothetical protein [Desulfovibrio sp. OttesenSCG-928-C14]